jgi:hypothetical protein
MENKKLLSLGLYPEVSLRRARDRRDEARKLLADGLIRPKTEKQQAAKSERSENSFEVVAREWFVKQKPNWAASHSDKVIKRLEHDVFPWLGPYLRIGGPRNPSGYVTSG